MSKSIIVFDGDCGICSVLVKSTYKLSKLSNNKMLFFTPLNSELGIYLTNRINKKKYAIFNGDTMIFYHLGNLYTGSTALIRSYAFASKISILNYLLFFPIFIRDLIYKFIAKNRYKLSKIFRLHSTNSCNLNKMKEINRRIIYSISEI